MLHFDALHLKSGNLIGKQKMKMEGKAKEQTISRKQKGKKGKEKSRKEKKRDTNRKQLVVLREQQLH